MNSSIVYVSIVTFLVTRTQNMATHLKDIDILQDPVLLPESPTVWYDDFNPRTSILTAEFQKRPARRPFLVTTIWEKDIETPLRDNTVIWADVLRLADLEDKVSALLLCSPWGKSGKGMQWLSPDHGLCCWKSFQCFFDPNLVPGRVGVSQKRLSWLKSFEALDPVGWIARGYAIVNVD